MSKRLWSSVGAAGLLCAAAIFVGAAPASATTTQTIHSSQLGGDIPVTCDGPGDTSYAGTGNSVFHITVNNAGDSWVTGTQEGTVTLQTTWGGVTGLWTGHMATWFGDESNNRNNVNHATFDFHGTSTTDPTKTIGIHAALQVTFNANLVMTVNNATISCR